MTTEGYTDTDLLNQLSALGVQSGDCLFIQSSLKALGKLVPSSQSPEGFEALLNVFREAVGEAGTVAVPAFNFGFCKGEPYDRQKTASRGMGAFSEFVRQHPSAIRSRHPFQSVAAIGKLAEQIGIVKGSTAFSRGSEFDLLVQNGCKILFFGVDFVETFVHVAEEQADVPYRFWKTFTSSFTDMGITSRISVDFFARKLEMVPEPRIDNSRLGRIFREADIIKTRPLGTGQISICKTLDLVSYSHSRFLSDPYWLLISRPSLSSAEGRRE